MIRPFKGMSPQIAPSAFVAETAVVIGDVTIGPESSIWYNVVARGDVNFIRIGARSNIQDLSMLHVTHKKHADDPGAPLVIGDDVTVGHSVTLHGCTIGNGAFIGMQAMVMDKAVVGEGALVGARALVTEGTVIPPHTLWVGAPAKYKRDLTPDEIAWLKRSAGNYVRYSREYLEEDACR
ncbi:MULTISPECIES: gamma carbonic anhydrase family protein [Geobacter]|uniref:gamma carbonic anhydrase family protein n=1 Tax=Geobacter TaxID=28231 RepID=UPI00257343DE|nr:gamma carbonic anhydrase family protein [Geobacter sulfurreducens]BEH08409.1 gamma carbonic anhydrase family protein [Geobacter sulfurreducens subsp. ethanolicus]BET59888.1 gamma carbonic anhydrase family protein [Geobacter sp. 60473]HML77295.1 gamma carbonic anhydrase family protein [Geobacter sulfurreducens]